MKEKRRLLTSQIEDDLCDRANVDEIVGESFFKQSFPFREGAQPYLRETSRNRFQRSLNRLDKRGRSVEREYRSLHPPHSSLSAGCPFAFQARGEIARLRGFSTKPRVLLLRKET